MNSRKFKIVTLVIALLLSMTSIATARTSIQKRFSDWVFARHAYNDGRFSCQVIQCASGNCAGKKYFLINAVDEKFAPVPEFNQGVPHKPNTKVTLVIGKEQFALVNRLKKPSKFFTPATARQLHRINSLLLVLSKSKSKRKFYVIDRNGQKRIFSARGVDKAFAEINKKCGSPIPN